MTNLVCVSALSDQPPLAPRDKIDEKQGKLITELVKPFILQPNNSSCETTCITNALHEMGRRYADPDLNFSLQRVNDLCGYRNNVGARLLTLMFNMKKALQPFGYSPHEMTGMGHTRLRGVLVDPACSYPVVGLSHEYLRNERDYRKDNDADHAVVVFRSTGEVTMVYDPFESIVPMPARKNQSLGRGVVALKTPDFIGYWRGASVATAWSFWIRKETIINTLLDSMKQTPSKELVVKQ